MSKWAIILIIVVTVLTLAEMIHDGVKMRKQEMREIEKEQEFRSMSKTKQKKVTARKTEEKLSPSQKEQVVPKKLGKKD